MTYRSLSTTEAPAPLSFSICSIITDKDEYNEMKQSFETCGFTDNCEYIIADNTNGNQFDAYQAINRFIHESNGNFLIIVHQDVRCIDNRIHLEKCLNDLSRIDSKWALCGNAGVIGYHQDILYINNDGKIVRNSNLPAQVQSLDENFLVFNKINPIAISSNIGGFHLYGTDLCIISDFLGYNSYVIPFMVKHLSHGNLKDLDKNVHHFIKAYGFKIRSRYIQTTCTKFYLSNSVFKNRIYNSAPVFFFVKAIERVKLLCKRIFKSNPHKRTITYE